MALLATLFVSKEHGAVDRRRRRQGAASTATTTPVPRQRRSTWLDWSSLDAGLVAHAAALAAIRRRFAVFYGLGVLRWPMARSCGFVPTVRRCRWPTGGVLSPTAPGRAARKRRRGQRQQGPALALCVNRAGRACSAALTTPGHRQVVASFLARATPSPETIAPRSIDILLGSIADRQASGRNSMKPVSLSGSARLKIAQRTAHRRAKGSRMPREIHLTDVRSLVGRRLACPSGSPSTRP